MHSSDVSTPRALGAALTGAVLQGLSALTGATVDQRSRRNAWAGMSENAVRARALREAEVAMAAAIVRADAGPAARARR